MPEPRHATRKPLFTKRHYEALAAAFAMVRADMPGMLGAELKQAGADLAMAEVMNILADDNPRFDATRFYEAAHNPQ